MIKKYVVGHLNPDTDSAVSAVMLAWFLNQVKEGEQYQPVISGDINKETSFVFDYWKVDVPEKITTEDADDKQFFLVDHNQLSQSIAKEENICGVVDHHLLGGLKTALPIYFRIEPVGSSSTLVYKMIKEHNLKIEKREAGLLLSAIISDTLNLTSPTTTNEDIVLLKELQQLTGSDVDELAKQMFIKKSDFSDRTTKEIITGDLKVYEFGGKKVAIGVAETASLDYFNKKEDEFIKTAEEVKKESDVDLLLFVVVDIVNHNSYFYPPGKEEEDLLKEVFSAQKEEKMIIVKGISSRKKDIIPPISKFYEGN